MIHVALGCSLAMQMCQATKSDVLDDLSRCAFDYFIAHSDPKTGFTLDRARNSGYAPSEYNVASIASTGFALSAYAVGAQRGWISRQEAIRRTRLTLKAVEEIAPQVHGWYYHWLDFKTGERQWQSEVSTIDTGIFLCGMIVAQQALGDSEIKERSERILSKVDWKWALTDNGAKPNELFFSHGWKPETGFLPYRWAGYCELLLLYVLGYGAYDQMPNDSWSKIEKPLVKYGGREFYGGGPLFLHQMSHVFVDFKNKRDPEGIDYWVASRNAVLANRDYCIDNPKNFQGYSSKIWGLSATDGPAGYTAHGAPGWIEDDGTLAPSSAVACAMFAPQLARQAAVDFARIYPETKGEYGFTISFNPTRKWQSPDVIGIDLGQMMLSIENAKDGLVNKWFMSHPIVKKGMERIGFRTTKEGDATKRPLQLRSR